MKTSRLLAAADGAHVNLQPLCHTISSSQGLFASGETTLASEQEVKLIKWVHSRL